MPASLHPEMVRSVLDAFPTSGQWKTVRCAELRVPASQPSDARNWSPLTAAGSVGGVYAFLFPQSFFREIRQIILDGPGRRAAQP